MSLVGGRGRRHGGQQQQENDDRYGQYARHHGSIIGPPFKRDSNRGAFQYCRGDGGITLEADRRFSHLRCQIWRYFSALAENDPKPTL
jgi:hypothetical protein